jgi:leucyl-tRNA synthetase
MTYDPQTIESKWQNFWESDKTFAALDKSLKPKYYCLVEFPYPSGEGLHVGHPRPYTALDILARKRRMEGYNVLYPIGFDAFGLPSENYAIKTGIHPAVITQKNIDTFTKQLKALGLSFDWDRVISTTEPKYYKWTQWIFLKMFEHGLAYKAKIPINWCLSCKIGLANEEVVNGVCERCGGEVEKREKEQWLLKITKYADRLIADLDQVDYLERIRTQQINWIGRSEGLEEDWQVDGLDLKLKTFTTWPHTTWGATFMVIAPEHPIIDKLVEGTEYEKETKEFCKKIIKDKIEDPLNIEKKKEGFFIGRYVINHLSRRKMPLYVANFAIYDYGTGIVKCTPAHDQRDFEFAGKYKLDIIPIIKPDNSEPFDPKKMKEAYTGEGIMMNAGQFEGMRTEKARKAIGDYTVKQGDGRWTVNYKLRDWVFSRQRYWGEPIPLVYCQKCAETRKQENKKTRKQDLSEGELLNPGWVAVPEKDLPVILPEVKKYQPTDSGESPLSEISDWVNTQCPVCGSPAKRETDTMPNWAGSNWYYLRYIDPKNDKHLADAKKLEYWAPVDWYNGGMEHTTLHLLYSRFVYKFLWDIGAVPKKCGSEPYLKRTSHGMILGEGGIKMSKSKGNVINPDSVVKELGADTLRVYEMFMGPFDQTIPWDTKGVVGVRRFLEKIWQVYREYMKNDYRPDKSILVLLNQTIKKVSADIETQDYNTAVSAMMIFINKILEVKAIDPKSAKMFLKILAPFAPHIAEELWQQVDGKDSIFKETWPKFDPRLIKAEEFDLIIQINGKVRAKIKVSSGITEQLAEKYARQNQQIGKYLSGQAVKNVIFVPGRLINFVI